MRIYLSTGPYKTKQKYKPILGFCLKIEKAVGQENTTCKWFYRNGPKSLELGFEELKISGRIKTIQIISVRINVMSPVDLRKFDATLNSMKHFCKRWCEKLA